MGFYSVPGKNFILWSEVEIQSESYPHSICATIAPVGLACRGSQLNKTNDAFFPLQHTQNLNTSSLFDWSSCLLSDTVVPQYLRGISSRTPCGQSQGVQDPSKRKCSICIHPTLTGLNLSDYFCYLIHCKCYLNYYYTWLGRWLIW